MEHKLSGTLVPYDYSFFEIQQRPTGMGVYNNAIGYTQISMKDISQEERAFFHLQHPDNIAGPSRAWGVTPI